MPSGPKKRRAAKNKNVPDTSFTNPTEEKLAAAVDTNNEIGSKGSQCVNEISLETPLIVEPENVERSDDVPVLESVLTTESKSSEKNGKKSQNQSFYDELSLHVPVLDSVIMEEISSESGVNMGEKYVSESGNPVVLQAPLIESGSNSTKQNECFEISQSAYHGPLSMVNDYVSHMKNYEKMNVEDFIEDPFKEARVLLLKCLHAMANAIDRSGMRTPPPNDAQDPESSSFADVSPSEGGNQGNGSLKRLGRQLMALLEEETRLKASYDDWHSRFDQINSQISLHLAFLDATS